MLAVAEEIPKTEVPAKARRRRYGAEYKRRILREAAECAGEAGAVGALLRREGLYSSHLTAWRQAQERGELAALAPKKRGRKTEGKNPLVAKVAQLERDLRRAEARAERAEAIIEVQKKVSLLLGIDLPDPTTRRP